MAPKKIEQLRKARSVVEDAHRVREEAHYARVRAEAALQRADRVEIAAINALHAAREAVASLAVLP